MPVNVIDKEIGTVGARFQKRELHSQAEEAREAFMSVPSGKANAFAVRCMRLCCEVGSHGRYWRCAPQTKRRLSK
jgi:hypothetical protein